MDEHNEMEKLLEELGSVPARARRPAARIMVDSKRRYGGPRPETLRGGGRRWVTSLNSRPDLRRFTRSLPVL